MTPTKIATFYLLRILFQTHFGFRHKRAYYKPFSPAEKERIFHWLYALMTSVVELSYKDFRIVTRLAFDDGREVCKNFYAAMEKIGAGMADVTLNVEDEFYTNKHPKDPKLPANDTVHEAMDLARGDIIQFSSNHSFMYRWMKRLLAQYTKSTPSEVFQINAAMKSWVLSAVESKYHPEFKGEYLPHFIDCSVRARDWVAKSIYFIQKNPRFAFQYNEMLHYTRIVQKRHPDVVEGFLLEAIVQVQLKDSSSAIKAMKSFFELSMFELNENMVHAAKTHRLAVPTQTPLMYAPILQARICRIFGDYQMARLLLHESLQQAQLRNDEICHQMANIEMHTVDILGCRALLEDNNEKTAKHIENERRVQRKALLHIDDLHGHTRSGPCCLSSEEDFELVAEMDSYGKMLMLMKIIAEGNYKLIYDRVAETGITCPVGNDLGERGRKVAAYGAALISSNMIHNGMYHQAKCAAENMLANNCRTDETDPFQAPFQAEPWAIGAVNLSYSQAGVGNYDAALRTIEEMRQNYPEELSWQSNRHVVICAAVINFERFLLKNDYKACASEVLNLAAHSELECKLRQALLLAAAGKERASVEVLEGLNVVDIRGRIRIHMQTGCIYTASQEFRKAAREFADALSLAENTTLKDIVPMVKRRQANMLMCHGQYVECLKLLKECNEGIEQFGSFTEKACYYMTAARCHRLLGKDPRMWLKKSRALVRNGQWPAFTKLVLSEIAALHDVKGLMPDENRLSQICEQFGKLTADCPGRCEWLLI